MSDDTPNKPSTDEPISLEEFFKRDDFFKRSRSLLAKSESSESADQGLKPFYPRGGDKSFFSSVREGRIPAKASRNPSVSWSNILSLGFLLGVLFHFVVSTSFPSRRSTIPPSSMPSEQEQMK
jgi:hypothetical protein